MWPNKIIQKIKNPLTMNKRAKTQMMKKIINVY